MKGSDTILEGSDTVMDDVWGVLDTILDTGMGGRLACWSFEIRGRVGQNGY